MNTLTYDRLYVNVPRAEKDLLLHFRAAHPVKHVTVAGASWEYIACGHGAETLLILPGLLGIGEMSFHHILTFESEYRVIAPTYPFAVTTVAQLMEGIAGILHAEGIDRAHVLGGSYGGIVAQCFVRQYPSKVSRLILSHTGGPKPERAETNKRFIRVLRFLPMGVLRAMLRLATRKSLKDAPKQRAFWEAYSEEMIRRVSKADLIARYQIAVDFDATSRFTPEDLANWPGRILILEGDNDPIAEAPAREALKAFHPQARVHTFRGTGHVASIAKLDEYVSVIKRFLHED
jgi:pimeloyl-ACP methyl ester carboxylesterase